MPQHIADRRDVAFIPHEQLEVETLSPLADDAQRKDRAFYDGPLKSAQFFTNPQFPVAQGKMAAILSDDDGVTAIANDAFGGK
jgi:hypothetical protein